MVGKFAEDTQIRRALSLSLSLSLSVVHAANEDMQSFWGYYKPDVHASCTRPYKTCTGWLTKSVISVRQHGNSLVMAHQAPPWEWWLVCVRAEWLAYLRAKQKVEPELGASWA